MQKIWFPSAIFISSVILFGYIFFYHLPAILWDNDPCYFHGKKISPLIATFFATQGHIEAGLPALALVFTLSILNTLLLLLFIRKRKARMTN
jgi:hypothetical protein